MEQYSWRYAKIGERVRVKISTGEDIRHLGELDKKLWSVLSCPVAGLEIESDSLRFIDTDKDGYLHVNEVIAVAEWLCSVLHDPEILFAGSDEIHLSDIQDAVILEKCHDICGEAAKISLSEVLDFMGGVTVVERSYPMAPYDDEVIAGFHAKEKEYTEFFRLEKLSKMGLGVIPEDAVRPVISYDTFIEMRDKIASYESQLAEITSDNANRLLEARGRYDDVLKLIYLCRDFCRLLRNFVTLEDFYDREGSSRAMFEAGCLVIDQRICHLVLRVNDMDKHNTQAEKSGIYLIYCDCFSKKLNATMKIVAGVTVGDINNLSIGKNAIFYDMAGNDWDATIYKIIDNPISIRQAFWSPYRKFGKWVTDLINKSAAEKDQKVFSEVTSKVEDKALQPNAEKEESKRTQAFDIAKFAGIFAAIGMALGCIGSFLTSVARGVHALPWWQVLVCLASILLVISGPSMIMAWIKLRNRNLSPLLNANGWAVNADTIISVLFGKELTEIAQFPLIQMPKVASRGKKWFWVIVCLLLLLVMVGVIVLYGECAIELFNK